MTTFNQIVFRFKQKKVVPFGFFARVQPRGGTTSEALKIKGLEVKVVRLYPFFTFKTFKKIKRVIRNRGRSAEAEKFLRFKGTTLQPFEVTY